MATQTNIVVRTLGNLLLCVHNEKSPTDADWELYLSALRAERANWARLRILVITGGGGPDAKQRKRLAEALAGEAVPAAVVSESIKIRFIGSMVALLNPKMSTFSRSELEQAFASLSLSADERQQAIKNLREMEKLVGSAAS